MKLEELTKNIFHLNFPTKEDLSSTFIRFQEHYESPEFRGKTFTLDEYKKWYIANSKKGKDTGEFTYYQDWSGFNIPSYVLKPFYQGKFNPLSDKEKEFLKLFKDKRNEKMYIIGTFEDNQQQNILDHEIAHGLFYTNPQYKAEVLAVLDKIEKESRDKMNKWLSNSGGYHPDVFVDETQAYLIRCNIKRLKKMGINTPSIRSIIMRGIIRKLNVIFEKYSNTHV